MENVEQFLLQQWICIIATEHTHTHSFVLLFSSRLLYQGTYNLLLEMLLDGARYLDHNSHNY